MRRTDLKTGATRLAILVALAVMLVLGTASLAFAGDTTQTAVPLPAPGADGIVSASLDATNGPTDDVYIVHLEKGDMFVASADNSFDFQFYFYPPGAKTMNDFVDGVTDLDMQDLYYKAPATGDYYFDIYAPPGSPAGAMTFWAGVQKPTSITISGTTNQIVSFATSYFVGGTLKTGAGAPLAGEAVSVWRQYPGGKPERISTVWTDDAGYCEYFSYVNRALTKATYTLQWAGTEPSASNGGVGMQACSAQKTITPRAHIGALYSSSTVYHGKAFTMYNYLLPRHSAGSIAEKFYCYRYQSGKWVLRKTVSAKVVSNTYVLNGFTGSKVQASVVLPYSGKWRIRAYHADTGHAATWGAYKYVTAR